MLTLKLAPVERSREAYPGYFYQFCVADIKPLKSWSNLVAKKALSACIHYGPRGQRLLPMREVDRFSKQFISLSSLARSHQTNSRGILKRLNNEHILSVSLPGKGNKLFVSSDEGIRLATSNETKNDKEEVRSTQSRSLFQVSQRVLNILPSLS